MPQNDQDFLSLSEALLTSFIDAQNASDSGLRAQLLANTGTKVLTVLEQELQSCESFCLSVAFVTMSGLTPLLQTLKELEEKNIPGKIITTDYLCFTEPRALRKLLEFSNIEVRFYRTSNTAGDVGFHTKGYIFKRQNKYCVIIGSSNLTQSALCLNREWNARLVGAAGGEFTRQIFEEFENLWSHPASLLLRDTIEDYEIEYSRTQQIRRSHTPQALENSLVGTSGELAPNAMQRALIEKIRSFMQLEDKENSGIGHKRGLLISATGTGKTYASAFAVKDINPRRMLFLVHRGQITSEALTSYRNVIGKNRTFGIYSGQKQESGADFVFATMQTMVKHLSPEDFSPQDFDVIVIDEVHRAGAESYQKIMDYFRPKLWLGMTATPDRTDGFDIYALFDHNILSEIRLQQALQANLLCPIHYFGITGLSVSDKDYELKDFRHLSCDKRVEHILKQSDYFGYSGKRRKALVFCSSIQECELLAEAFAKRGHKTVALSGKDSVEARDLACERLSKDEGNDLLDFIFTVDVFNEGIDIPPVNQIILLRPTQSPIIFVQQIGRGLRKYPDKEYVVILDFIGEYANNFMIPVALSGDKSYKKDTMRRVVSTGTQVLSGASTIHFDKVARERIFKAIDSARTNSKQLLKQSYKLLRYQLGRIPKLVDFLDYGSVDPLKIFEASDSYYLFLKKDIKEAAYSVELDALAVRFLNYLTKRIGNAQRPSEALVLEAIICGVDHLKSDLIQTLQREFSLTATVEHLASCEQILSSNFWIQSGDKSANADLAVIENDPNKIDEWRVTKTFQETLRKNKGLANELQGLIDYVKRRYQESFAGGYRNTMLKLYERYTYEDVCRLLNWSRNVNAQNIGGYFYDKESKTLPVFINYEKVEDAIAYEDRFVSENHLIALSKTKRKASSADADHIFKRTAQDQDNHIYLFVRKNKDDKEAKSFYFLGEIHAEGDPIEVTVAGGSAAFEINYRLESPIRNDIYSYLTQ